MKQVQYVTIGDEYAKRLGYEELVGSMAVVDNVLKALVGVTVLSGHPAMIGKQVDIHKGDAILMQDEAPEKFYAVADFVNGTIYYSGDMDFTMKVSEYVGINQTQIFKDFKYIHELLDELHGTYPFKRRPSIFGYQETREPMNWVALPLDDESCEVTKKFRDTYISQKAAYEARAKRTVEIDAEKKAKVQSLTDSFKSQLTAHLADAPAMIDWNPDDAAADWVDAHEMPESDDDGLSAV
jgi:hypothetical protein